MATGVVTGAGVSGIPFDELHRMTVDEYERMAESGVLDDPQVELINGLLVKKMVKKPRHVSACELVAGALEAILPKGWYIREQNPLRIPDYNEPEPDLVIARGSRGRYATSHPGPDDVALVVEVADTSLGKDRGEKAAGLRRWRCPDLLDRESRRESDRGIFRTGPKLGWLRSLHGARCFGLGPARDRGCRGRTCRRVGCPAEGDPVKRLFGVGLLTPPARETLPQQRGDGGVGPVAR